MQVFEIFSNQFLPAILFGCFVQVATIFVLLRVALGLNQFDLAVVTLLLSLVISAAFTEQKFPADSVHKPEFRLKISEFMQEQSDPLIVARLPASISEASSDNKAADGFFRIQAVYLLSQFKRAISVGLLLIVPLFLIDFLVAVALSLAGIQNLSVQTVAIPLKLLLLAMVNAWDLILSRLLTGFI